MKKIVLLWFVLFVSNCFYAQNSLDNGALQLNAGFGTSSWGTPVYVGLDYGLIKDITLGAEASYRSKTVNNIDYSAFSISGNGNYHLNTLLDIPDNWDVYAGANVSYFKWSDSSYNSGGINFGGQLGGRYYFSDNFGVNLEFGGGGVSGGKIGITYKL